jgi:hypothetical protein
LELWRTGSKIGLLNWPFGALGGTRTPNLLIRSQMLYPIELQAPVDVLAIGTGPRATDADNSR